MINFKIGTLGSEYYENRIKDIGIEIEARDEEQMFKDARLLGFYKAAAEGLIKDLKVYENSQNN